MGVREMRLWVVQRIEREREREYVRYGERERVGQLINGIDKSLNIHQ